MHAKIGTPGHVVAVAGLTKQLGCSRWVRGYANPLAVAEAEAGAAGHGAAVAALAEEGEGAGGVGFDAGSALVEGAEPGADFGDAALAGGVEECGGALLSWRMYLPSRSRIARSPLDWGLPASQAPGKVFGDLVFGVTGEEGKKAKNPAAGLFAANNARSKCAMVA